MERWVYRSQVRKKCQTYIYIFLVILLYEMEQAVLSTLKDYETSSSCLLILCKNTIALENRKMIEPLIKSDNRIFEEALQNDMSYSFSYKSDV